MIIKTGTGETPIGVNSSNIFDSRKEEAKRDMSKQIDRALVALDLLTILIHRLGPITM